MATTSKPAATGTAPPDAKRAEKGLSLIGLMKYAVPYTKAKSLDVVVKKMDRKLTRGKCPAIVAVCQDTSTRSAVPHKVTIIGMDPDQPKVAKQKKILVECDCEDHTFTWEYALWTWGAAKIKKSNGEPAVVKNPGNYPGQCKHVYRVLKEIKAHGL
jgi:hypothetical protein